MTYRHNIPFLRAHLKNPLLPHLKNPLLPHLGLSTSNTVTSSPGKRVHLRTELFTQLEKLEGLYEKGCVTKEQCDELKKSIMGDIKGL